ncbi:6970_t:CDS:2 [Ambispora gerdemannii]|uniref:6970_t:CDS:1 n=1 Tax=Ambispora gerdemannii TaxID=144530 RepID=A0A9N8V173_9GLOM|nr:6970_t:CDS:2 [Ambispora gerdemannii]
MPTIYLVAFLSGFAINMVSVRRESFGNYREAAEKGVLPHNSIMRLKVIHPLDKRQLLGVTLKKNVKKDPEKANSSAVENGSTFYKTRLAVCYYKAIGTYLGEKVFYWYNIAANEGDKIAQRGLAICYSEGIGVEKDVKHALTWLTKPANQGDGFASAQIGWSYLKGIGIVIDARNAVYWFLKSTENSMFRIGDGFRTGAGVVKDIFDCEAVAGTFGPESCSCGRIVAVIPPEFPPYLRKVSAIAEAPSRNPDCATQIVLFDIISMVEMLACQCCDGLRELWKNLVLANVA